MTDQTQTPAPAAARITIDDVRTAIEGTDPNSTNASKIRAVLGRGSFETIQKHLVSLRQELATAAAPPVAADQVPPAPPEAVAAMWAAAWSASQVATLRRTETLAAERDAALLKLATMAEDVAGLVDTVDELTDQAAAATAATAAAGAAHLADLDRAQSVQAAAAADRADLDQVLERTRQQLAQAQADAVHAAELAEQGRQMMRDELARLTDQVGELKAHLYKRADAAPAV